MIQMLVLRPNKAQPSNKRRRYGKTVQKFNGRVVRVLMNETDRSGLHLNRAGNDMARNLIICIRQF